MKRHRMYPLIAAAVLLAGTSYFTGSGFASAADPSGKAPVPQGVGGAVLQQATVFGDTPLDTPVTVSIVLRTANTPGLTNYIQQVSAPGPQYRQYLTVNQFAAQYGQPSSVIAAITGYLGQFGIQTSVYANNLVITANGTAGQFDQAFAVKLQDMGFHGKKFHGAVTSPLLPVGIADPVLAVLGLTNYGNFASHIAKPLPKVANVPANLSSLGQAQPGTPGYLAQRYNVSPLYQAGDTGQGQTIGIVTLASFQPSDAETFWSALGLPASASRINEVPVDGGAGPLNQGSIETTIDVEQSGALAPGANIVVYEAPNSDYGYADAFWTAITQNVAGSLSTSWGESEDAVNYTVASGQESPNYAQVFTEAFMEAAAQGMSTFAASGDSGAYDASADLGTTDLSVDTPADSPYVTAAGGTTLPVTFNFTGGPTIVIPQERAWGYDYFWPYWKQLGPLFFGAANAPTTELGFAEGVFGGDGGGYSALYSTPWYQQGVSGVNQFSAVKWLTPIQNNSSWTLDPKAPVVHGRGDGRNIPDVAMDADPDTGYIVYSTLLGGSGLGQYGGTSFVAPQLAGITALINSKVGTRVGFWNPQIYRFASAPSSPFTPLDATGTSNDNLYYTGTPGTVYNPGSGLGTPDVSALAADFAAMPDGKPKAGK